jgi:hypothetical protein
MTRASTVLRRESRIVHELDGIARLRSSREAIPSFRYTARRWYSTVFGLTKSAAAASRVVRARRACSPSDVALVQGGLTTTMELVALGRPFVAFPLRNHFEQRLHVRHRLDRYGARRWLVAALTEPPAYRPVATDGAAGRGAHGRASLNQRCRSS